MTKFRSIFRLSKRLAKDTRAVAFMEFALMTPAVLILFLYGGELANLALTHMRVSQIAHMTADNTTRVRDRIDEADVNEIFYGDKLSGDAFNLLQHGRIIISSVEDNDDTPGNAVDQRITWQRCKGMKSASSAYGAEGAVLPGPIGTGTRTIEAEPGEPIVAVEIQYDYQPLFSNRFFGAQTIKYSYAYLLRDRSDNSLQNGGNLSGTAKATCGQFNATF